MLFFVPPVLCEPGVRVLGPTPLIGELEVLAPETRVPLSCAAGALRA